eukprot:2184280-Amphidinium_carterae.2
MFASFGMAGMHAAASSAAPVQALRSEVAAQLQTNETGHPRREEVQTTTRDEMIDSLVAYIIEVEGGEMKAERIAQFYQANPPNYKKYFMKKGLRNLVTSSDKLTWDSRNFIRPRQNAAQMPGCALP